MSSTWDGDVYVNGNLGSKTLTLPASSVGDNNVAALANVAASKLEHQHERTLSQAHGTAAADERRAIHRVYGATGTLVAVYAGPVVAAVGDSTVSVDVKKNGTSMLSSVITLTSSHVAYQTVAATLASTSLVQGDVLEIILDATVGTGTLPQGVFATVVWREKAQ